MEEKLALNEDIRGYGPVPSDFNNTISDHTRALIQFEKLISEISAKFINISPDHVDSTINHALKQILLFFDVDRCHLLRMSSDRSTLRLTHCSYNDKVIHIANEINLKKLFPWSYRKLSRNEIVSISSLHDFPPEAGMDKKSHEKFKNQSILDVPISVQGSVDYDIVLSARSERIWPAEYIPRLRLLGEVFVNALLHRRAYKKLQESYREVNRLKDLLQAENDYLHVEIKGVTGYSEIIGQSSGIQDVMRKVQQVALSNSTVLIQGETGTGKELIARAIHKMSNRSDKKMMKVDCTSLPPSLIEGELFGREKGAYTGAQCTQLGRFEVADGSTLFFDEIGELPLELQGKLLRVLQDREFERLGSTKTIRVNVRIIAATNRNLADDVRKGKFREDLFYRLNVFQITVPPLRERIEDIPLLTAAFVSEFSKEMGKKVKNIPVRIVEEMQRYRWPGNIRELRNVIENAVVISSSATLNIQLPKKTAQTSNKIQPLKTAEYHHILRALESTNWCIKGPHGAAKLLDLKPSTLYNKMKRLQITISKKKIQLPEI
jgi:formate hydrogenlyase transcriptional activator